MAAGFLFRAVEIADHVEPDARVVVGAVDAHAVHSIAKERADEIVVGGGIGGHGDHDADAAVSMGWSEQHLSVLREQGCSFADANGRFQLSKPVAAGERGAEHAVNVLEGAEDVSLAAAERGQSEGSEFGLELAEVVTAEDEVVGEIAGAAQMLRMDGMLLAKEGLFELQHLVRKVVEGLGQVDEALVLSMREV